MFRRCCLPMLLAGLFTLSGCYSMNAWGPDDTALLNVEKGQTKEQVMRELGMPVRTVDLDDGREILLYQSWDGINVLFVYQNAERTDHMLFFDDTGTLVQRVHAKSGKGLGIISPLLPVQPAETSR